jgi:hypothetical protein
VHTGPFRDVPTLGRDLEPRLHGVQPAPRRPAGAAPVPQRRHGTGPGAPRRRPAGRPLELRHGPLHAHPRDAPPAPRPRPGGVRGGAVQLPGHRRSQPGGDLPHCRRGAPVERGARLRPAPDRAARRAPRPPAGPARSVPRRDGRDGHRRDGRRVSARLRRARAHPGHRRPRGSPVRPDPRRRHGPARGGAHPAHRGGALGRAPAGRGPVRRPGARGLVRLQAPRHLRVPDRPDHRAGGRVRRPGGSRGLRGRSRRAARAEPSWRATRS